MCFPGHFTFQYKHLVERCQLTAILHLERGGHGTFYEDWDAGTSRAFQIVREFVDCLQRDEDGLVAAAEMAVPSRPPTPTLMPAAAASASTKLQQGGQGAFVPVLPTKTHYTLPVMEAEQELLQEQEQQRQRQQQQEEEDEQGGKGSVEAMGMVLEEEEDEKTLLDEMLPN